MKILLIRYAIFTTRNSSKPNNTGTRLEQAQQNTGSGNLANQLLKIIFGCYFVVTMLVTAMQLLAGYRQTEQRVTSEIQALQATFGPAITDAVWRFNLDVLSRILRGMNQLPIVSGVLVEDELGKIVKADGLIKNAKGQVVKWNRGEEKSANPSAFSTKLLSQTFDLIYIDENGDTQKLGKWTVFYTQSMILNQLEFNFYLILIAAVIKTLALWFIFLLVIERKLGQPLKALSRYISNIKYNQLPGQEFVLAHRKPDELGNLVATLNQMTGALRDAKAENDDLLGQLKLSNQNLEAQVSERTRELEQIAMSDKLTGLANRRKLDQDLSQETERKSRYGTPLSVILMDIDWFKNINDRYGHLCGDEVLIKLAATLRKHTRHADLAGRWGGEEFMIICHHTQLAGANALAQSLQYEINSMIFPVAGHISCSFGVAELAVQETLEDFIQRVDSYLYHAKQRGRNRIETCAS